VTQCGKTTGTGYAGWFDQAEAERAPGELAGLCKPYLLIRPFIRCEAMFSSRLEGTRASLSDLLIC
jgi:hypothetical protein